MADRVPQTIDEAHAMLAGMARANLAATLIIMLDRLVDLACAGGNPLVNPAVRNHLKLMFYQGLIADLRARVIDR